MKTRRGRGRGGWRCWSLAVGAGSGRRAGSCADADGSALAVDAGRPRRRAEPTAARRARAPPAGARSLLRPAARLGDVRRRPRVRDARGAARLRRARTARRIDLALLRVPARRPEPGSARWWSTPAARVRPAPTTPPRPDSVFGAPLLRRLRHRRLRPARHRRVQPGRLPHRRRARRLPRRRPRPRRRGRGAAVRRRRARLRRGLRRASRRRWPAT